MRRYTRFRALGLVVVLLMVVAVKAVAQADAEPANDVNIQIVTDTAGASFWPRADMLVLVQPVQVIGHASGIDLADQRGIVRLYSAAVAQRTGAVATRSRAPVDLADQRGIFRLY